ncbi:hypothetical protein [Collinsella stercoris]
MAGAVVALTGAFWSTSMLNMPLVMVSSSVMGEMVAGAVST